MRIKLQTCEDNPEFRFESEELWELLGLLESDVKASEQAKAIGIEIMRGFIRSNEEHEIKDMIRTARKLEAEWEKEESEMRAKGLI